jgi:hypothetical protein
MKSALSLFICLLFLNSCSLFQKTEVKPEPVQKQEEEVVYHKVKFPRETYQIIAMWYTKSAKNVNILIAANPNVKPTRIRIGDLIKIPKELLKRPKSLPRDFVDSFYSKPETEATQPETRQVDTSATTSDHSASQPGMIKTEEVAPAQETYEAQTSVEETYPTTSDTSEIAPADNNYGSNQADSFAQEAETAAAPAISQQEEDENAKVREKLMKELLE